MLKVVDTLSITTLTPLSTVSTLIPTSGVKLGILMSIQGFNDQIVKNGFQPPISNSSTGKIPESDNKPL